MIRAEIWDRLEAAGVGIGPVRGMIPAFAGADLAAWHLAQHPCWTAARVVKTNPDHAQAPIRLRALHDGKTVYTPVPCLTAAFPYLRLDPALLAAKEISFELAATPQGFLQHGQRVEFEEIEPLDFCVVGSVAVSASGGRTGKGAGFADLETGIFRTLGLVSDATPMATTVHSLQVVPDDAVVIEPHDTPLDIIATEAGVIETHSTLPRPCGIDWQKVRPDQFAAIPFLAALRDRLTSGAIRTGDGTLPRDDPEALAEVTSVFHRYEAALLCNDVALLDEMFLPSERTVRYGVAEVQYGIDEVRRFRATQAPFDRSLSRTVITTFGRDVAIAATLFHRADFPGQIGRQMQTWIRTDRGWLIAAAHVSMMSGAEIPRQG